MGQAFEEALKSIKSRGAKLEPIEVEQGGRKLKLSVTAINPEGLKRRQAVGVIGDLSASLRKIAEEAFGEKLSRTPSVTCLETEGSSKEKALGKLSFDNQTIHGTDRLHTGRECGIELDKECLPSQFKRFHRLAIEARR